ncbi:MAG TPA: selenium cofactor biosynthesis protein YqeC, partial [Anaerolineales bacterium]|nr:selenium cofactor biosynthesis protein YqeC [Anaerolineales bacterium]
MSISLSQALRFSNSPSIAFIGSGGKTTAMFLLAKILKKNSPVIVTSSTHLGVWQVSLADSHLVIEADFTIGRLEEKLHGITLITGRLDGDRITPLDEESLALLNSYCKNHSMPLLIEADGSRQKPLKAWAEHEPPIPPFVEQVVQIVGLTGIGKPLGPDFVHRPEIFSALGGLRAGEIIAPDDISQILTHPQGGKKNIPRGARHIVMLNQADTPELQSMAHGMAQPLLASFHAVIVSSLKQENIYAVHEAAAGILLAAGGSTRFGKSKQMLDWKGQPFVRAVASKALEAGLSPVMVVVGANAEQVGAALEGLDVRIVKNLNWATGQASSIREAIRIFLATPTADYAPERAGSAIFLLVDQPQITTSMLHALVEKHAEGLFPIVAPMVIDRRANPVLFDRITFPDLLTL